MSLRPHAWAQRCTRHNEEGAGRPAPRPLLVVTAASFSNSVVAAHFSETLVAARFPETLVAAHASDSVRELAPPKTVVAAGSSEDARPR